MTNTAQKKIVRTNTDASFPFFIDIYYKDKQGIFHQENYVNADEAKVFNGITYEPLYFSVTPPSQDNTSVTDGKITMSDIDNGFIEKIRNTQERIKCVFVAGIVYDESGEEIIEEIETMTFFLVKAQWNESELSFTMMFDDRMNLNVPLDVANVMKVPALG